MSQPRYAPAGLFSNFKGISIRGTLFAVLVVALAGALGLPAVHRSARTAADATPAQAAAVAPALAQSELDSLLERGQIRPSAIATAAPALPRAAKPTPPVDNGGLIGPAAETGQLGIPTLVLKAYQQAAAALAKQEPSCHLPWWLLAGIGHTESGHAESGRLYADGTTRGRILGPRLNGGIAGDAVITDTDQGAYDGDTVYDRAVGPMQFIPSTWKTWGSDGNGDGKRDPNNVFDATLAAARYLCADGRNLATTPGLQAAVLSYNHSQAYLNTVLAWGYAYRNGASAVPDQSIPVINDVTKVRPPLGAKPPQKPHKIPTKAPVKAPSTSPAKSASTSPTGRTSAPTKSASATPTCTRTNASSASSSSSTPASPAGSARSSTAGAGTAAATASADGSRASSAPTSSSASSSPTASC